MAKVLVVDTEEKGIEEIRKAVLSLNPENIVEAFLSFDAMKEAVFKLEEEEIANYYTFDLLILDYLAAKPAEWVSTLAELKEKNKPESVMCLTAFDDVNLNKKHIQTLHPFNIFYKPFDQLILRESINIALSPNLSVKPAEMHPQSFNAQIAILKEIELLSISELGFLSLNDKPIVVGGLSKYFSAIFSHGKKRSVLAQCLMSIPLPNNPGQFINKFQYVGLESEGLLAIRKFVGLNKKNHAPGNSWSLAAQVSSPMVNIALLDTADEKAAALKEDIDSHFDNVRTEILKMDWSKSPQPLNDRFDIVINLSPNLTHDEFKNKFSKEAKYFLLSPEVMSEERLYPLARTYRDIFIAPIDKAYFFKKLKTHHKGLTLKNIADINVVTTNEKVKAASLVKISEICELYVNVTYSRELAHGTMRDFIFMKEDENQVTELPAFCNFSRKTERSGEKTDSFFHQFVFFGMTDHYLKQIRMWLLESFVQQKGKN